MIHHLIIGQSRILLYSSWSCHPIKDSIVFYTTKNCIKKLEFMPFLLFQFPSCSNLERDRWINHLSWMFALCCIINYQLNLANQVAKLNVAKMNKAEFISYLCYQYKFKDSAELLKYRWNKHPVCWPSNELQNSNGGLEIACWKQFD